MPDLAPRTIRALAALATLLFTAACGAIQAGGPRDSSRSPRAAAEQLLAADRANAARAEQLNVVDALGGMFRSDVVMSAGASNVQGRDTALTLLRANADNLTSRLAWTPIKAGISSDGNHGFTQGYMTIRRARGDTLLAKYLAYWIRGADGWRVAVYKRVPRPAGVVSNAMLPPSLSQPGLPSANADAARQNEESLRAAEQAFSDEAQRIGIGPAFFKWGAPDAVNVGQGASWVVGPDAIAGGQTAPSARDTTTTLSWASSQVIVAPTGDLGVSIGYITVTSAVTSSGAPATAPRRLPFFTIWKRPSPTSPWRYVAE